MHTTVIRAQAAAPELVIELRSYALLACIGIAGMLLLLLALAVALGGRKTNQKPRKTVAGLVVVGVVALIVPLMLTGQAMQDNDEEIKIAVARAWPTMTPPDDLNENGDHAVDLSDRPGTACVLTVRGDQRWALFSWTGSVRCGDQPVVPGVRS